LLRHASFVSVPTQQTASPAQPEADTGCGCAPEGTTLCVQGQPLFDVMVPLNGTVDVSSSKIELFST
jgi:hypothetical protein